MKSPANTDHVANILVTYYAWKSVLGGRRGQSHLIISQSVPPAEVGLSAHMAQVGVITDAHYILNLNLVADIRVFAPASKGRCSNICHEELGIDHELQLTTFPVSLQSTFLLSRRRQDDRRF